MGVATIPAAITAADSHRQNKRGRDRARLHVFWAGGPLEWVRLPSFLLSLQLSLLGWAKGDVPTRVQQQLLRGKIQPERDEEGGLREADLRGIDVVRRPGTADRGGL